MAEDKRIIAEVLLPDQVFISRSRGRRVSSRAPSHCAGCRVPKADQATRLLLKGSQPRRVNRWAEPMSWQGNLVVCDKARHGGQGAESNK